MYKKKLVTVLLIVSLLVNVLLIVVVKVFYQQKQRKTDNYLKELDENFRINQQKIKLNDYVKILENEVNALEKAEIHETKINFMKMPGDLLISDLAGNKHPFKSLNGHLVLLVSDGFCGSCIDQEIQMMKESKLFEKYQFAILSDHKTPKDLKIFMKKNDLSCQSYYSVKIPVFDQINSPTYVKLNQNGQIVDVSVSVKGFTSLSKEFIKKYKKLK